MITEGILNHESHYINDIKLTVSLLLLLFCADIAMVYRDAFNKSYMWDRVTSGSDDN